MSSGKRGRRRDFVYPVVPPRGPPGFARVRPSAPRRPRTNVLRDVGTGMLGLAVLAGFWAVMLVFGVALPVFGAMHVLYSAGYIAHDPVVPGVAWTLGRESCGPRWG